MAQKNIN